MSDTVSFVRDGVEDSTTPVTPEPAPSAEPTTGSEVARREANPGYFDEDAIRYEDIAFPRLNIVQFVGKLMAEGGFTPGSVTLAGEQEILTAPIKDVEQPVPLSLTVLGFRPLQYAEKLAGGKQGRLFNSEAEVVKNNGTLNWKEWDASKASGKPLAYFQTLATALVLVEKPADFADPDQYVFPYSFQPDEQTAPRFFALALWGMKGSAYTKGAKVIRTQRACGSLRKTYLAHAWTLTTKKESKDDNYYFVPKLRPSARNSDLFQTFLKSIIGAQ